MKQKILILGVTGMVGHKLFTEMSKRADLDVYATCRSLDKISKIFEQKLLSKVVTGVSADNFQAMVAQLEAMRPDAVINCIGITKKLIDDSDPLHAIEINSCYPHRLAKECSKVNARMIQIATDCVFNGAKGNYLESDPSDATDLYGRTKFLGEVDYPNAITLRTSFIGHELGASHGLLEWFLAQGEETQGFTKAIYSGLPTVLIAKVIVEHVLPNPELHGLYQVSSGPINKYDLLCLTAKVYDKKIKINPDDSTKIDRSLNSDLFRQATGYVPLSWEKMIEMMHEDYKASKYYQNR